MNALPRCYGIIPARYDSQRFPGKPLAEILGKPMFWHVYTRAAACRLLVRVVLATDDERIFHAAEKWCVPVVMTRRDHPSGTDRVLEAARRMGLDDRSVVVNIQGDEPLIDPDVLRRLVSPFRDPDIQVTTLACPVDRRSARSEDLVKVALGRKGRALYFSRAAIPWYRAAVPETYLGHIGIYAFRMTALQRFVRLGPGRLEKIEALEQLRLLENDIPIHVVLTDHRTVAVDRPEDLKRVVETLVRRRTQDDADKC